MVSTADCVKLLNNEDLSQYSKLIDSGKNEWKRVNKFKYKDRIRRYFYFTNSCLLATVDEVNGALNAIVRPPMLWELYMLIDSRPTDDFLREDGFNIFENYYDFCMSESVKYSEPEQYYFMVGPDDGGWICIGPKKCEEYDQHIGPWVDHILPTSISGNEVMEITYTIVDSSSLDSVKANLEQLGFEYVEDNDGY